MENVEILKRRLRGSVILIFIIIIFCIMVLILLNKMVLVKEYYKASDFNIKTVYSKVDYNKNGIDDYSDFLLGAKKIKGKNSSYEELMIKVFQYAGYNLDKMVDNYFKDSKDLENKMDRISLYKSFINDNATKISINFKKKEEFQPGDFIFLSEGIGLLSDKRDKNGLNYIIVIENGKVVEKEGLKELDVSGHYRFDSSLIDDEILKKK